MPKLLVVDGSPMMHRIMELTFAPEGIQVVTASDGEEAIALLPVARPDIVIADHAVSGRSGYELSAFIKGHPDLSGVPVLLLASPFEPLDRDRAESCGVAGEIAKPFEPAQLIARVRELLTPKPVAPSREPAAAVTEMRPPALKLVEPQVPPTRGALDDYFDRLDAALERLDDQIARAGHPAREEDALPTVDQLLGEDRSGSRKGVLIDHPLRGDYAANDTADSSPTSADPLASTTASPADDAAATDLPPARGGDLSGLVEALEALRRRGPGALPPMSALTGVEPPVAPLRPAVEITEDMIDEVARRVVQRLAPGAIDRIVTEVVTQVAEKLLREEIARLK